MTNQEFVFQLLKSSRFSNIVRGISDQFKGYLPPLKGDILEHIVADSLCDHLYHFKAGSKEQQRDFSLLKSGGRPIHISMKTGKIRGKKDPKLVLNGSRMGGQEYKCLDDRIDVLNDRYFDAILSCILISDSLRTDYHTAEFRFISPKIFPKYKAKDFKKLCKSTLTHVADNGVVTTITPNMAHLAWYYIPLNLLKKNTLTISL